MNITKNQFLDLPFYIHQSIPPKVYVKKTPFFQIFPFIVVQILPFQTFFSKKNLYLTFAAANFAHHVTYHWKALEEQIPNIFTFMGQKTFIFQINSVIIFTILPKKYLNSLSHQYYQNSILDLHLFTYINQFLLKCTSEKTLLPVFFNFDSSDIATSDILLSKNIYMQLSLKSTLAIMQPIIGKFLQSRFQIYILFWVINHSFFR